MNHCVMHYVLAIFGWFLYNLFILNVEKDKDDLTGNKWNYKRYWHRHWDNLLFTFCLAPVLVYYMNDIVKLFGEWLERDIPQLEIYYLGCGVLTEVLYYLLSKLTKLKG